MYNFDKLLKNEKARHVSFLGVALGKLLQYM